MSAMAMVARRVDKATVIAFGCIILLLLVGSLYKPDFLSVDYLRPAASDRLVPRHHRHRNDAGHPPRPYRPVDPVDAVDGRHDGDRPRRLHRPGPGRIPLAIPFGILCGTMVGLVNGLGVAYLRAPSMIFTLGTNAVAPGPDGLPHRRLRPAGHGDALHARPSSSATSSPVCPILSSSGPWWAAP